VIIYIKFLDHSSGTNTWISRDEYKQECIIEECEVVGFLEYEDDKAYYLTTMRSPTDVGSGHTILKSAITYVKKMSKKPVLKRIKAVLN